MNNLRNEKLILKSDRFFVAGSRGMVGKSIVCSLKNSGYGIKEKEALY